MGFKGVWIPREIWLDERLNALDKVILAEIVSLSRTERGCCAGNQYLADFCKCSASKVSRSIAALRRSGYIETELLDGRHRRVILLRQPEQFAEAAEAECLPINIGIKKGIQESKKGPSYDELIDSYTEETELREALRGFVQMRCAMRKKPTNRALELLFQKLDSLAEDTETKIAILNQSILNGWQGVFPLKDEAKPEKKDDGPKPNWYYG